MAQFELVVQVWPGRAAGVARFGNAVSCPHLLAHGHFKLGVVAVGGGDTTAVINDHQVPVESIVAGAGDDAVFRRAHGRSFGHREIEPGVELAFAGNRVLTFSKG